MKTKVTLSKGTSVLLLAVLLCALLLCACGSDPYTEYAAAYNKVSANGCIDADINAVLTLDGQTNTYNGNFKVDSKNNLLYYEMTADGNTTTQFSDGSYLYTARGNDKVKYSLSGGKPSAPAAEGGQQPEQDSPEFNTSDFLNEFSSFLEAGKIKELGLLDPIPKAAVTKTVKNGDTYSLTVANSLVERFVNTMAVNQSSSGGDTVQVKDLKNFSYTATVKNGFVKETVYAGDVTVTVPASLMSDGNAQEYTVNFKVTINFNNPGEMVTISLPATDEYREVKP